MRARSRGIAIAVLVAVLGGQAVACRPAASASEVPGDLDPAREAERLRRHLARHPDDAAAWRELGLLEWIWLGRPDAAAEILEQRAERGDDVARVARLLMAEARLDIAASTRHAYALIEALAATPEPREGFRVAAAESAALSIAAAHGDQPGDDERFVAFYEKIGVDRLPWVVAQPLRSVRAGIARRRGEEFRPYFAAEGCVQAWQAGPLLGTIGAAELARLEWGPFEVDPEARLTPLSCVTRIWNPTPRAGIRRLRTFLDAPGTTILLDVSADEPVIVRLDGHVIARSDRSDRFPASRRRLELTVDPGPHELELATAIPGENTWVLVRAVDADGRPLVARTEVPEARARPYDGTPPREAAPAFALAGERGHPSLYAPLEDLLVVEAALGSGDADRAESLQPRLAAANRFAEAQLMRARFERADPSRTATISAAREQRALESALALDPGLDAARLRLLEVIAARGDENEVERALAALPEGALHGLAGELFRFSAQRQSGNEHLALEALARARAIHPEHCSVLMAERALAREREDVAREDEITARLAACGGSLELRARLAETRADYAAARALWEEVLARTPDEIQALEALARIAAVQGQGLEAAARLRGVLSLNPLRVGVEIGLADLAAVAGDFEGARGHLRNALGKLPHGDGLRQAAALLGIEDDLLRFRVDGRESMRDYVASGASYDGVSEVLVLDRSVARVYPNGGQRTIVHLVVHLLSKDALDRYGEIDVPEGARLLTLRSIKPDGSVLAPEVVPGKDGVELRHLEVGDFVDYEFLVEQDPASALPGYVDVTTFRFQSLDIPYHRSELFVVYPPELPLTVDRRNAAPVAEQTTIEVGGEMLAVWHFLARDVPRLGVEQGHRALLDEVPNVRVYTQLDLEKWLDNVAANVRTAQRSNPELRRLARSIVRGQPDRRAAIEALWRWVVDNVEDAGDLSSPATATLAGRRGDRLMLIRAMAEVVGLRSELWLLRDGFGPRALPGGHPMIDDYDGAMLAFDVGEGDPLLVTAVSDVMPLGYLTPGYARGEALRVPLSPGDRAGLVTLPALAPGLQDRRQWTLDMRIDGEGSGRVGGSIVLQGMEAVVWRQALREVDRDRIEELFAESELGWLRGATIERLVIRNEHDLALPLRFEFEAYARGIAIRQGGSLVMRSAPLPLNQSARFTALPRRSTGMVVPYAPAHTAEIRVELDGSRFVEVPQTTRIDSSFGSFVREVDASPDRVTLRYTSVLETGVVEPTAYPDLAEFSRKIEAVTQALLRAER